ncbi:MAG: flagellar hook-associated protein FlgK [Magnetococcales bacterium]|nr:flagellar hook-associated protein FlgK [Magnetococcales bacterium]MEC8067192.1 flagellar hook-associated protein FlgK [Pseudomonadota bacterium]|tara:strand:+ start:18724 stop:20535 length:1812 start_codon:yes stop_codon:yes gene_type:complete
MSGAPTLNSTLNIALSALQTTQTTLSTVSHNISNVNTEGYVRQQVINGNVALGGFGGGVNITEIRQVVDRFLEGRITGQTSVVGYAQTQSDFFDNIEVIFGTPGSDASTEKVIGKFFNDLANLANAPDSTSLQLNAVKNGEFVVQSITGIATEIQAAQQRADDQINESIDEVNEAIKKIFDLNNEIVTLGMSSNGGANANDLLDERQRQVNTVAKHLNVNVLVDGLNRLSLTTETGRKLVDSSYVQLERIAPTPPSTFQDVGLRPIGNDGTPSTTVFPIVSSRLTSGGIKGLMDIRDVEMENILAEVNNLASTMIDSFNRIHSQGTGIPPLNQLTTGNGNELSGFGADVTTELNINVGDSFDISIVDIATGSPITTTLAAGGGAGPIAITAAPTSLTDIANAINANADIGADITAAVIIDADGFEQLQVTANNASYGVVMRNNVGNVTGELGINNFFTGNDATDMAVRADISADPARIASARMRETDGGVSFQDNRNMIALAQLSESPVSFAAAGGLAAQNKSMSEYFINISSNLAIRLDDSTSELEFQDVILSDMESRFLNTSGVNLDEELSNLLVYQRSYQASARIVSVVDELLQTLVNIV